ncbi:MAG: LysM peptidoglycan-binding domain-containing protein [Chloroflexi bacterium]|nr:LysM peptidoglycan-binding domain-containing protein [Chloroflexota bacterium]
MRLVIPRFQGLLLSLFILSSASACVQPVGSELEPTPFGQQQPTWTPLPTLTPQLIEQVVIVTNTPDPFVPQEAPVGGSEDAALTDELAAEQQPVVPQATTQPEALSPDQMRATQVIQNATATVDAANTATAAAMGTLFVPLASPTATTAAGTPQPILSGTDCVDEVRAGDNLYRIATRYGLRVTDVAVYNNIANADVIFVGQRLTIPGCGTTGYRPLPTSTPRATTTPTIAIVPGGGVTPDPNITPVAGGGRFNHTVAEGETLFEIAQRYGVTVTAIAQANGIVNPDLIDMGQVLAIP